MTLKCLNGSERHLSGSRDGVKVKVKIEVKVGSTGK